MLDQALLHIDRELSPVTPEQLAVGLDRLRQHARTYRIDCDITDLCETHARGCSTIPASLYPQAIEAVLAGWSDTYRLPPPGAFVDHVRERRAELTKAQRKLETADWKMGRRQSDPPVPRGELVAAESIDQLLASVHAHLSGEKDNGF